APVVEPAWTVAETTPFTSDALDAFVIVAVPGTTGSQVTGMFANGLPVASSARAVRVSGAVVPGLTVWLFPPVIRNVPSWLAVTLKLNGPNVLYPWPMSIVYCPLPTVPLNTGRQFTFPLESLKPVFPEHAIWGPVVWAGTSLTFA